MKVTGFTFIRNALKYDYPIVEAITSVLPVCNEFVVMVGNSEDATRKLIEDIASPKIIIYDSVWDDSLREGGRVLAVETDKAYSKISEDTDWCFYIQGDEVLHEKYQEPILTSMKKYKDDLRVEGLLFDYQHFYGSYDFVGDSRKWYRREIRIVRKNKNIYSFRDAQGFKIGGKRLRVKRANACMYHYGWVKPPEKQQEKQKNFHKMWHDDEWMKKNIAQQNAFDYTNIDSLARFTQTHPKVMAERIKRLNWQFNFDPTMRNLSLKHRFYEFMENNLGLTIGEYKNYKLF